MKFSDLLLFDAKERGIEHFFGIPGSGFPMDAMESGKKVDVNFLILAFIINDISLGYILGKRFFAKYSKYFITQKSLTFGLGLSFYFIFGAEGVILGLVLSYVHFTIIIFSFLNYG